MIIGITGLKRSGKSTLAKLAVENLGFEEMSFAAPIRSFIGGLLGLSPDTMDRVKEEPVEILGGVTPRYMMQTLGTEWGRQMVCDDLWIRVLEAQVHSLKGSDIVISDIRFDNEARWLRDSGGVLVKVERGNHPSQDTHVSEEGVSSRYVDLVIKNDNTPEKMLTDLTTYLEKELHCE